MASKSENTEQQELNAYDEKWQNPMKRPRLEKLVLNIGVGTGGEELERAAKVLESISGKTAKKTLSRKNVKEFNLRKGRPIGVKVTIRGKEAEELLKRILLVNNNRVKRSSFDDYGNFGFGIKEHISIPGVEYDNLIGIWGLDVVGRITRPGMRVKYRRVNKARIPKDHYVSHNEAQYFLEKFFNANIVEKLELDYF
ncbi:MAG: 50S ribosomal protein L5 [Candidatus Lokiarchaeota archaeon]|nr:50S ribosomal protein L5 [Candidatus Lokiarchaeota archaeon]MBD3200762.1 50S ribosomal protein L5 [Candidatus Lokiarchaeota archaeon]